MIAILIFAITLIYLSISVSAALTFDNNSWYILVSNSASGSTAWTQISQLPTNIVVLSGQSAPSSTSPHDFYVLFQANHIITADDIIVIQVALQGLDTINISGVGTITNANLLPPKSIYEPNLKTLLTPNQTIIATTIADIGYDTKRITITFRAGTFTNNYVFAKFNNLTRAGVNVTLTEIDLYDSVEDAAGSGTTPEEMREVLDAWSEETLLPGIGKEVGDQIEDKVPGAVEDALNNHDQQQETQAGSKIDEFKEQLQEAIDPYFENTSEIRDALHGGLTGVFGYSGTNAVITLPAANNPMADGAQLWPQLTVDLGYWWNQLPAALRSMITIYATFVILYCCLSEMLDTINTILIHRELLGLPDDEFGISARSRGD